MGNMNNSEYQPQIKMKHYTKSRLFTEEEAANELKVPISKLAALIEPFRPLKHIVLYREADLLALRERGILQ